MVAERFRRTPEDDEERRRRLNLRRFSHDLSRKILTMDGKVSLGSTIPEEVFAATEKGSIANRDEYWKDLQRREGQDVNFGQQMQGWLLVGGEEDGQNGIVNWVHQQTDTDTIKMLQAVDLLPSSKSTAEMQQSPQVLSVINAIANDLSDGNSEVWRQIDASLRQDPILRSLNFYATYLSSGDGSGQQTQSLVDTLVTNAYSQARGDETKAMEILQKVAPLLSVTGLDAQQAVGALTVATAHVKEGGDSLQQVVPDAPLNEDEQKAWTFIQRYQEKPTVAVQENAPVVSEPSDGENEHSEADSPDTESAQSAASASSETSSHTEIPAPPEISQEHPGFVPPPPDGTVQNAEQSAEAGESPESLELERPYQIVDVLSRLTPGPDSSQPYFIDKDIPTGFAQGLSEDQAKGLELTLPYFQNIKEEDGTPVAAEINPAVFAPDSVLARDGRYGYARELTYGESDLLSLAAASGVSPEQQASLYQTLGEIVLRVHANNPDLLEAFLRGQTRESILIFMNDDRLWPNPKAEREGQEVADHIKQEMTRRFGIDYSDPSVIPTYTPEQQAVLEQLNLQFVLPLMKKVTTDISEYPGRFFSFKIDQNENPQAVEQLMDLINLPETKRVWETRVTSLQEALQKEPLELTVEQMRQIEFLGHSVNVQKVMEMLKGEPIDMSVSTRPSRRSTAPEADSASQAEGQSPMEQLPQTQQVAPEIGKKQEDGQGWEDLASVFAELSTEPHRGHNFYTDNPENLHVRRLLAENWRSFLLQKPTLTSHNLGAYAISSKNNGIIIGKLDSTKKVFLRNLQQDGTRSSQAERFIWDLLRGVYKLKYTNDTTYEMDSTIFAFAADVAPTPKGQEEVFYKMAEQVLTLYDHNSHLRKAADEYFRWINEFGLKWPPRDVDRLVGTDLRTNQEVARLQQRMKDREMDEQDLLDISFLALPFDLAKLATAMEVMPRMVRTPQQNAPQQG